jgi:hypothetical protein
MDSWKLERADRVEADRMAALQRSVPGELASRQQAEAAALGRALLGDGGEVPAPPPQGTHLDHPLHQAIMGGPRRPAASGIEHPEAIVLRLESTGAGCRWLLDRWAALSATLERTGTWGLEELVEVVRLRGQLPLGLTADRWKNVFEKLDHPQNRQIAEDCQRARLPARYRPVARG